MKKQKFVKAVTAGMVAAAVVVPSAGEVKVNAQVNLSPDVSTWTEGQVAYLSNQFLTVKQESKVPTQGEAKVEIINNTEFQGTIYYNMYETGGEMLVVAGVYDGTPITVTKNVTIDTWLEVPSGFLSGMVKHLVDNIDRIAPHIATFQPNKTVPTKESVLVTIVYPEDADKKQYSLNGGTNWLNYTGPIEFDKNGGLLARSTDIAGNTSAQSSYDVTNIDKTAPEKAVIRLSEEEMTNRNVSVFLDLPIDAAQVQYRIDGGTWTEWDKTIGTVEMKKNGLFEVRVFDTVGNVSEITSKAITNIDKVTPQKPVLSLSETKPTNGDLVVTIKYPDDAENKWYRVDNGGWKDYQGDITVSENSLVEAIASDKAGNSSDVGLIQVMNIDKETPDKPFIEVENTKVNGNNVAKVKINYSSDAAKKEYRLDRGVWKNYTGEIILEENADVEARAIDAAGNISEIESLNVLNINNDRPTKPEIIPSTTEATKENVFVTLIAMNVDVVLMEYRIGTGAWMTYAEPIEVKNNAIIEARAKNEIDNYSLVTSLEIKNIDRVAPNKPVLTISTNEVTNQNVEVIVEYPTDAAKKEIRVDGGGWADYYEGFEVLENGLVEVRAIDAAGNISATANILVKNIDKSKPEKPTINVSNKAMTNADIRVEIIYSGDSSKKEYRINSGEWQTYTGEIVLRQNGLIEAREIDKAGNQSEIVDYQVNNIDKTAPDKPSLYPSNTERTNDDVLVTVVYTSDVTKKQYRIGGGEWLTYTAPIAISENTIVEARGTDSVGNVSDIEVLEISNIFKGDLNGPIIQLSTQKQTNKNITVTIEYPFDAYISEYRVNGEEWQEYYGDFEVVENGSIEARTRDYDDVASEIVVQQVTNIDKTPPTKSVISKSTSELTNKPVEVTITYADDADKKEYRIDSGEWKSYTGSLLIETNGRVEARSTDAAGNVSSIASSTISNIDTTAPDNPIIVSLNEESTNGSVAIDIQYAMDSVNSEYRIDEGLWVEYVGTFDLETNGKIEARSTDEAGNVSGVATFNVNNIDKDAPVIPIISLSENNPTNQSVQITIDYLEEGTINEYRIDDGLWVEYIAPIEVTKNVKIEAKTTDKAGNTSDIALVNMTNIDLVAPGKPTITASTEDETDQNVQITISYPNDVEVKEYRLNGGKWLNYVNVIEMRENGRIEARGYDDAGNVSEIVVKVITNIDKGLPGTPNITVSEDEPTMKDIEVTIYYEYGVNGKQYRVNGGEWKEYNEMILVSENGTLLEARAMDANGIYSEITEYKIENIDREAPEKPTLTPSITMVTNNDVSVNISYPVDARIKEYRVDGGEWLVYSKPVVVTKNGVVEARAKDVAGNQSEISKIEITNIDKSPAVSPIITVSQSKPTNQVVVVSVDYGKDVSKKEYRIDGGEWLVYSGPITFAENGKFEARGTNSIGNESIIEAVEIENIDKVAPIIPVYEISNTALTNQNLRLVIWFNEELSKKEFRVNGGEWRIYSNTITVQNNGIFEARETDEAGNVSEIKLLEVGNIDKLAPVKPLVKIDDVEEGKQATITFSEDSLDKMYRLNGGDWNVYVTPFNVNVGDVIETKALDEAGNESTLNRYVVNEINVPDIPEEPKEPEVEIPVIPEEPKEPGEEGSGEAENPDENGSDGTKEPEAETPEKPTMPETDITKGIVVVKPGEAGPYYELKNGKYIVSIKDIEISVDEADLEKLLGDGEELRIKAIETNKGLYVYFNKINKNGKLKPIKFSKYVDVTYKKLMDGIAHRKTDKGLQFIPQYKDSKDAPVTMKTLGDVNVVFEKDTVPYFKDVIPTIFSKGNIDSLAKYGVIKGIKEDEFGGKKNLTRAEFAVFLVRALGLDIEGYTTTHFKDVKMTSYYGPAVQALYSHGYIAGKTAVKFSPKDEITREEAAVLMARILKRNGVVDATGDDLFITDMNKVAPYAKGSVQMLRNLKIINGYGSVGQFSPKEKVTRYQMAAILDAVLIKMKFKNN